MSGHSVRQHESLGLAGGFLREELSLRRAQLQERKQECQGRFGALILVDPIRLEAVVACPSRGIDERDAEIIASEEPIEDSLGPYMPVYVFRLSEGSEAGSDCRVGFNGLLIKARTLFATPVKAVATDGYEVPLFAKLEFHQPRQRSDTCPSIGGIVHVSASEQQCTGQCSIIVGQNVLEPRPVLRTAGAECLHQLVSKIVARALHIAITGEAFEVFVDAEQCKRPGTRSGKLG